jgi:cytochrome c oxidase subunit II
MLQSADIFRSRPSNRAADDAHFIARSHAFVVRALIAGVVFLPAAAHASPPLNYLQAHGTRAYPVSYLLWGMMLISVAVVVIISVLLLGAVYRRRQEPMPELPGRAPVERAGGGLSWITIGVGVSTVVLFGVTVWTVVVLAAVGAPPLGQAALNIEVAGHQWWWEVRYLGDDPSRGFRTANEIHIPVGQPVVVKLTSPDVIHSFWVPALTGKTDTIPGQTNMTWFEARKPGIYQGQCTEYCGQQHAHMGLQVIASAPDAFEKWRDDQLAGAPMATSDEAIRDENLFVGKCGICHTVRGTRAGGLVGPDLSHFMSRRTIAAATLRNTPEGLLDWITDPQRVKPGTQMPRPALAGDDLDRIVRYIQTLQ